MTDKEAQIVKEELNKLMYPQTAELGRIYGPGGQRVTVELVLGSGKLLIGYTGDCEVIDPA